MTTLEKKQHLFALWVAEHTETVYHTLRGHGLDTEQAREITQEAFFQAWRSMDRFEGRSHVRTWLIGIALNIQRKAYARQRRTDAVTQSIKQQARTISGAQDAQPEGLTERKQTFELLQSLIAQLKPARREVFVLFYLKDFRVHEIAEALGRPEGTIRSMLQRAKEEVSQLWQSYQTH